MKTVFTTGQVAQIVEVSPRLIVRWFDNNQLKGYRLPNSKDRRIPRRRLVEFLSRENMTDCIDNMERLYPEDPPQYEQTD